MIGNIPQKLRLFIRKESSSHWGWDDVEDGKRETKVRETYISDASNKKTCETGKTWAEQRTWDYEKKVYIEGESTEVEVDNVPFSGLKIVTLEIRDKGGRAYKVMGNIGGIPNIYFDMREDVLLDCLFNGNLKKDGEVSGQFIFARIGSQMKPIRIGSHLHSKMVEATNIDARGVCSLEVGGVYESKNGDRAVYLGEYWTYDVLSPKRARSYHYSGGAYHYDTSTIKVGKPIKVHVFNNHSLLKYDKVDQLSHDKTYDAWFYVSDYNSHGIIKKKGDVSNDTLLMIKSHSFKKKIADVEVPKDYVEKMVAYVQTRTGHPYINYAQVACGKLLCLSKERGYVHPLMAPFIH